MITHVEGIVDIKAVLGEIMVGKTNAEETL
jgi:hypothetical protein